MRRRTWALFAGTSVTAAAAAVIPATVTSAAPPTPTVRVVSVLHTAEAERFPGDSDLFVSLGVYLAAVEGPFELQARRLANGSVDVTQVRRASNGQVTVLRHLPPDAETTFDRGLGRFFHLTWLNRSGATVAQGDAPFCPAGFSPARIDDSGPLNSRYPSFCGSGQLTKGTVWGIDRGFAVPVADFGLPNPDVPDGTYTLKIAVASKWATALAMRSNPPASVTVHLTSFSGGCGEEEPCAAARARRAGTQSSTQHATTAVPGPRPDLVPLPAFEPMIEHERKSDFLAFAANVWNAGPGPLLVEGFRRGEAATMPVTQYFVQDGVVLGKERVGIFDFDARPTHQHWHFEDFATYELVSDATGKSVVSGKQSFCLAPTDVIDLTVRGADLLAERSDLNSSCGGAESIWIREALPSGWGDTYFQSRAGQAFDITKLPNGVYFIRVTANPDDTLAESSYTNNVSLLKVILGGTKGNRTVDLG